MLFLFLPYFAKDKRKEKNQKKGKKEKTISKRKRYSIIFVLMGRERKRENVDDEAVIEEIEKSKKWTKVLHLFLRQTK